MTTTSIGNRLRKIENARRPPRGLFFVAWGRTPAEIEEALTTARQADEIATGEPVVRATWPFAAAVPASRWVHDEMHTLTRTEFSALIAAVDEVSDRLIAKLEAEIAKRGHEDPRADDPLDESFNEAARRMNDAALLKIALAVPLSDEPAEPGIWSGRLVPSLVALSTRANIRGSREPSTLSDEETRH